MAEKYRYKFELVAYYDKGVDVPYKDWEDVVRGSGKGLSWKRETYNPPIVTSPYYGIYTRPMLKRHKARKRTRIARVGLSKIRR